MSHIFSESYMSTVISLNFFHEFINFLNLFDWRWYFVKLLLSPRTSLWANEIFVILMSINNYWNIIYNHWQTSCFQFFITFNYQNYVFLSHELRNMKCELQTAPYQLQTNETTTLKEKKQISPKLLEGGWHFRGELRFPLLKVMIIHSASCWNHTHAIVET